MSSSLKLHQEGVRRHEEQLAYHKAKMAEILANRISAKDIVLGRTFVHGIHDYRKVTVLSDGFESDFFLIGGYCGNPYRPFSNMQHVTAIKLAGYLNAEGFVK